MNGFIGKAKGAAARNASMTPEERKAHAQKMAHARKEKALLPVATHTGVITIGTLEIPCYVTKDGARVLSGRGMQEALRLVDEEPPSSGQKSGSRMDRFLGTKSLKSLIYKGREADHFKPIKLRFQSQAINGFRAEILPEICEAMLEARDLGMLDTPRKQIIAKQCDILMRGFARVGIIALVDEATGYQKDRARDALAKILEAYVAKELRPWVNTFPTEYYEHLFRIYEIPFPPEGKPQWRPQFFGTITNDVIYDRLAPELLPELKKAASKAEKKAKLHQWLTSEFGHPKLREHLVSIVTLLKLSHSPEEFKSLVDRVHPRFGDTILLDF
ncbi:MAG: P63C domain-containing protein [Zoogloeaceae bacterium]|nr:P63C domain-containing protein [Zoogloeaceae bacterium]